MLKKSTKIKNKNYNVVELTFKIAQLLNNC